MYSTLVVRYHLEERASQLHFLPGNLYYQHEAKVAIYDRRASHSFLALDLVLLSPNFRMRERGQSKVP
jgi:hypothetical protein